MKTVYTLLVGDEVADELQYDTIQKAMQSVNDPTKWDLELGEVIEVWQLVKKFRVESTLKEIE